MANIVDCALLDKDLNPEQAFAAKKIAGPMLILAGAGSGKTRCITYKIAHLVSAHNVEADRILAVTFTNKAAREMKSRIYKLLGCNMDFAWMGTFHSVCLRMLKLCLSKQSVIAAMGGAFFDSKFSIYDDDDQKRILKEILKENLGENFEPSEVKKLHSAISRYKNTVLHRGNGIELQIPEIAKKLAAFADEEAYANYYEEYQKRLLAANAMDFDDLLFNTVLMLQRLPSLAKQLSERFRYVIVDEYQDTNDVQYELLKLLINANKNVTVVGDDDQSIYGWRGANIKIIRNFHSDFSPVTIVKLERNYRSTANIVRAAGSVIAHNIRPKEMEKQVFSKEEVGEKIHVGYFFDDRAEAFAIANSIAKAGESKYSETAIFYRTNAQSRLIEKALNDKRIPSVIYGGMRFWDRKEIKDILAYMRALANEKDDAAYLRIINTPPRAIGKATVETVLENERTHGGTFFENLLNAANSVNRSAPKLKAFTDLMLKFKDMVNSGETPLPLLAERIVSDTLYKEFLRKDDELNADERIGNLDEMINAIREFDEEHPGATLGDFLQDISLLTDADKKVDSSKGLVTLMTIHMAKGLEFDTVHIAGVDEEIFPLVRASFLAMSEQNEQIEEERRLFYVGCTRAEKRLYLYHAERRFYQGNIRPFAPSRFLKELDQSVVEFTPCLDNEFSNINSFRPARPNLPQSHTNFSHSNNFTRNQTQTNSIKKNDRHIIYSKPIKMERPINKTVEPKIVYDDYSENPMHPGVRVRHIKYGIGVVTKCYGTNEGARVDVRFSDNTVRTIILKYGALQIVG